MERVSRSELKEQVALLPLLPGCYIFSNKDGEVIGAMLWYGDLTPTDQLEKDKVADEREDKHWEEISKLTTAVNNNTEVLSDLVKHTMGGGHDNEEG